MKALDLIDSGGDLRTKLQGEHEEAAGRAGRGGLHGQAGADADPAGDARRRGRGDEDGRTSC